MWLARIADIGPKGVWPTYKMMLTDGRFTRFTVKSSNQVLGLYYAHALQRFHDLLQAACKDKVNCADPDIIGSLEFWRDSKLEFGVTGKRVRIVG